MQINGTFTAKATSQRSRAALLIGEPGQSSDQLLLAIEGQDQVEPVNISKVSAMMAGADWRITLTGRGVFTLSAALLPDELTPFLPTPEKTSRFIGLAERLGWRGMTVILSLIIMSLVGARLALPYAADHVSRYVPQSWGKNIGNSTLNQLDSLLLEPSQLSTSERRRIDRLFSEIISKLPPDAPHIELLYRRSPTIGPNALALAGNHIILLDEMVDFAGNEDVLVGILAHEVGHITNRHAMRMITRSAILAVGLGLVFGIEDSFVEEIGTLGSSLILASYTRAFELEADQVSTQLMQQLGRDPASLISLFDKLATECAPHCDKGGFFASHPSFRERRNQINAAAKE